MRDWVKIKTNVNFVVGGGQSPIVKCLLHSENDEEFFKKQMIVGIKNSCITESERLLIVQERIQKIVEWRKILDKKFEGREKEKKLCILSLGHLIAAHYSGKAQSYAAIEYTLIKLANAMSERKPIIFTFCFGGYKNYTSPAYPEVDWAELFNMNYLISYLYPLIKGYEYGVEIEYESEEVSIQFNNVPQAQTNQYTRSFKELIEYYVDEVKRKYGINLVMRLVIARDLYENGESELYRLMDEKKAIYREAFESLADEEKEKWIQRAESNFMWKNGVINYGEKTDEEKYEIYKEARITNEAFLDADYILRESWFENPYRVPLTGTWGIMPSAQPIDGWLHIKSTANSKVDCWIGTGFLEAVIKDGITKYNQTILSKSQLEMLGNNIYYVLNSEAKLKKISKNFDKVPLYNREDWKR